MISILSLVYNHERYLDAFFEGILSQKLEEKYELIIGVDKSDDKSLEICLSISNKYPEKIKVIQHDVRMGMSNNFLAVHAECKGEFIAICEGDDYWIDDRKLQKQLDLLLKNKGAALCFTNIEVYEEEEEVFQKNWANIEKDLYYVDDVIKVNPISFCSVMFRNTFNSFSEAFAKLPMLDWPLYIHLLMTGYAIYLPDITAVYRRSYISSYSKNSILQQLEKKSSVYEYLIQEKALASKMQQVNLAYHLNLYAIAIRLPEKNYRRTAMLRQVGWYSLKKANATLMVKSIFKRII